MTKNMIRILIISAATLNTVVAWSDTTPESANVNNRPVLAVAAEMRFTGFSNNAVSADTGLAGMHHACSSTYGAGTRMCLDIEVFKTPGLKTVSSVTRGWLQPTSVLSGDNPGSLSCNGWSVNTGGAATWLTGDMQIIYGGKHYGSKRHDNRHDVNNHCENHFPVACCR
jgi:hypothetical protein